MIYGYMCVCKATLCVYESSVCMSVSVCGGSVCGGSVCGESVWWEYVFVMPVCTGLFATKL